MTIKTWATATNNWVFAFSIHHHPAIRTALISLTQGYNARLFGE